MTVAPITARLEFEDIGQAVEALRDRGLRLSTSRRLLLRALFAADEPVSAEEIATGLELELTSVYRNLETLERHGLVRHVHLGHGAGLYALVGRGEREYLYCERCGAVRAVDPSELERARAPIREDLGFDVRFTHFALVGTCADCAARGAVPGHHH